MVGEAQFMRYTLGWSTSVGEASAEMNALLMMRTRAVWKEIL